MKVYLAIKTYTFNMSITVTTTNKLSIIIISICLTDMFINERPSTLMTISLTMAIPIVLTVIVVVFGADDHEVEYACDVADVGVGDHGYGVWC